MTDLQATRRRDAFPIIAAIFVFILAALYCVGRFVMGY